MNDPQKARFDNQVIIGRSNIVPFLNWFVISGMNGLRPARVGTSERSPPELGEECSTTMRAAFRFGAMRHKAAAKLRSRLQKPRSRSSLDLAREPRRCLDVPREEGDCFRSGATSADMSLDLGRHFAP